ncbi:MAG: ImmA/IrrE family metallo-endopeptidase [Romboutsia sp.]
MAVNKDIDSNMMRFTIAHELVHYYLSHLDDSNKQIVEFHR